MAGSVITQAITKGHVEPRGPGHPHSIPPASTSFNCHNQDSFPWTANILAAADESYGLAPPQSPLLSSDHGFESDRSSASTSSSVAAMSERSGGSRCPQHGRWPHREPRGHMKINLPVFKDENIKDAITYQSWHWDLTVYHHTGCRDCTLLPYAICSLQNIPRGAGEEFGDRHYPGWCPHHTG